MIYVAVLMLMLAAIAVVAWPLLNPAKSPVAADSELSHELDDLANERDTTYRAIKELEFEHQLGNLSQQDYQALRERYRTEAAGILRQLERARRPEKQTAAVSAGSQAPRQPKAAAPPAPAMARTCQACGNSAPADDRFCWHCGAALERICPACQTPRPSSDVFCGACGIRLEGSA